MSRRTLAVTRRFTADTAENRVMKRVILELLRSLEDRFGQEGSYDGGPFEEPQQALLHFCRSALRQEPLSSIPASEIPQPNNVLLGDRDYSRVWRAWEVLQKGYHSPYDSWPQGEELFARSLFWQLAGRIVLATNAMLPEFLVTAETDRSAPDRLVLECGEGHGIDRIDLLLPESSAARGIGTSRKTSPKESSGAVDRRAIRLQRRHRSIELSKVLLPLRQRLKGRVKFIKKDGDRHFGFISGNSGEDYYFDPRTAGGNDIFHSLENGSKVTFVVGVRPPDGSAPAFQIQKPTRVGESNVHVVQEEIVETLSLQLKFRPDDSHSTRLAPGRGFPVFCTLNSSRVKKAASFVVPADVGGYQTIAGRVLSAMRLDSTSLMPPMDLDVVAEDMGLDPFGGKVHIASTDLVRRSSVRPVAIQQSTRQGDSAWQVSTNRQLPSLRSFQIHHSLDASAGTDDLEDNSNYITASHLVARALAEEFQGAPSGQVAFVVPDGSYEFQQHPVRAAMMGSFPHSLPVGLSIAAALAWQRSDTFSTQTVEDGEGVLVLCADGTTLSFNLLVARRDKQLQDERPESAGFLWERRPPLPTEEYGEGLGVRDILTSYAHRVIALSANKE